MSDNDYNKLRRLIYFLMCLVVVFVLLLLANLVHSYLKPDSKSFPAVGPQGPKGDTAQVDYDRIAFIVSEQVAALPRPQDGRNGKDGRDGKGMVGASGSSCTAQQVESGATILCTDGSLAMLTNGTNGQDGVGVDGRTPEFRTNPETGDFEWRYIGDRLWQALVPGCTFTNTCEAL